MTKIIVRANKSVTLQHLGRAMKRKKTRIVIKVLYLKETRRERENREDDRTPTGAGCEWEADWCGGGARMAESGAKYAGDPS